METATFPLFQQLPPELRQQIWQESMPTIPQRPLFFYKKGCWAARRLTEMDYDYDYSIEDNNLCLEFKHENLDPLQVEFPLYFVNREARISAIRWVVRQGLQDRVNKDKQSMVFTQPFDPEQDTIYVSREMWHDFHCEPLDRLFEPDLEERNVDCPAPAFTRLAVPDEVLFKEPDTLAELFESYYGLQEIFIILSVHSDGSWQDVANIKPQELWDMEVTDFQWPRFCWNLDNGKFEWKDGYENVCDYPLYDVLQHARLKLSEWLLRYGKKRFEISPAIAVRK